MVEVVLQVGRSFFDEMAERRNSPGEIVMVIPRPNNKVLLMTKEFYPMGVYRLPTGKMKRRESVEEAYRREIREETSFNISARLLTTIHYTIKHGSSVVEYKSYVMITDETSENPMPEDEDEGITDFKEVPISSLAETAQELRSLQEPWHDWGCFRAVSHDMIYRLLSEEKREGR